MPQIKQRLSKYVRTTILEECLSKIWSFCYMCEEVHDEKFA